MKINLDKYKKSESWSEVIKLYSGLFDEEIEREKFIIDLARNEIHLASECATSSAVENSKLESNLKETAFKNFEKNPEASVSALLELNDVDRLFLSSKNTFRQPYGKRDKAMFDKLAESLSHKQYLSYLDYVTKFQKITFLLWLVPFMSKHLIDDSSIFYLQKAFNRLFRNKYYNHAFEVHLLLNQKSTCLDDFVKFLINEHRKDAFQMALRIIKKHKLKNFDRIKIEEALTLKNKQFKKLNSSGFFK
ncbi:hypothetical protein L3X39_02120 [Sabulilitoribacter multivorans]|uniref:Uncharacterized protein n=1 Tax=Flaviramulus multivorans TaxID=1304750 RepID=A0ABS9IGV6_9FLAO|nr:hypothetical protein [Flaviramulus multivorans]MCF7559417.1 hypothetical protein [Flaviramulus multivorans]